MKIQIEINTDNSAFEDDLHHEVERILSEAIRQVYIPGLFATGKVHRLRDVNGNTVGFLKVTDSEVTQ